MNKPSGYVCKTVSDRNPPVYNLLPSQILQIPGQKKLHTIGRLDLDTEGLLLFTTDGKLSHNLTIPQNKIPKTYFVKLEKKLSTIQKKEYENKLQQGFYIPPEKKGEAFTCSPSIIQWINDESCNLTITEGKFHQIKRMFLALENKVVYLKRIKMGPVELDYSLKPGEYRNLSSDEIDSIFNYLYNKNLFI